MNKLFRKLLFLFRRRRLDRELNEEMRFHLEMNARAHREAGLSPEEAAHAARREFGNPTLLREVSREMWGWASLERLAQDLRYALRMLRKNPGFASVAVLVLGLGIGGATAMFTIVDGVLLRPLPFPHADRLVRVGAVQPPDGDWVAWWSRNHTLEALAIYESGGVNFTRGGSAERVPAAVVSAGFFSVFDVPAALGRVFTAEEERSQVAVVSHSFWLRHFTGSDPVAVGETAILNGIPHAIIGVMPAGFGFPGHTDLWVLMAAGGRPPDLGADHQADLPLTMDRGMVGRLRAGVSLSQAQAEHKALFRQFQEAYPRWGLGQPQSITLLQERLVGEVRRPLVALFAAVVLVLLIACANVANLLLARAAVRQREVALRLCMGATRARILQQLLTESVLLALAGGAVGVLFALWSNEAVRTISPATIPRLAEAGVDHRVLAFAFGLSLLAGILAGLAPAVQGLAPDLTQALKAQPGGRSAGGLRRRVRRVLVVGEVALALVLLIGAGLMIQSFWRLIMMEPGLDPANVITAELALPKAKYDSAARIAAFWEGLLERTARLSGVTAACTVDTLPLGGKGGGWLSLDLRGTKGEAVRRYVMAQRFNIGGDYFRAMGIPLLRGRPFTASDAGNAAKVMIVNRTAARLFFHGDDPVGGRLRIEDEPEPREIIGVAGDVKFRGLGEPLQAQFYLPHLQPDRGVAPGLAATLIVRAASDAKEMIPSLRELVSSLDSDLPLFRVRTMEEVVSESTAPPRFRAILLGTFAVLALVLAVLGVYGVIAYSVVCRTHEIGVRMSLGARPSDILVLIVGDGTRLALTGALIGLAVAAGLMRSISSLLFGITAGDPGTYLGSAAFLVAAALAASVVPARRASKVDPMSALKYE